MKVGLKIWRQADARSQGCFMRYLVEGVDPNGSVLDALDLLNEKLVLDGDRPVAFDSDCREGICGACGIVVDGMPHGARPGTATCEAPMRDFEEDAEITLEPFRTGVFQVLCDLVVDRSALDRVISSGGFVSMRAGSAPEANAVAVPKEAADAALDAAQCIGCGACVAACPNGAAALFAGAKLAHLATLPQGQPERTRRALSMARALDAEGFGACSLHGECARACPKKIPLDVITQMNHETLRAALVSPATHERGRELGVRRRLPESMKRPNT